MLIWESNLHTYKTQCSSSNPAEGEVKKMISFLVNLRI